MELRTETTDKQKLLIKHFKSALGIYFKTLFAKKEEKDFYIQVNCQKHEKEEGGLQDGTCVKCAEDYLHEAVNKIITFCQENINDEATKKYISDIDDLYQKYKKIAIKML